MNRKKNIFKAVVAIAIALAMLMPVANVFGETLADTIISIDPPTQNVAKGETFTVDVLVIPGEPIIAVTVDLLTFDPALIQASSVIEGDLFEGLNTFFIPGTIDNIAGTITLTSIVTIPATSVSDPGTFCIIEFTAQDQFGTSVLDLEGVEASDELGSPVSVVVNDGEVVIPIQQFTLTIDVDGVGDTSPTPGIHTFDAGITVPVTAIETDPEWFFGEWSGDVPSGHENDNPVDITMTSNKSITATFTGPGWSTLLNFEAQISSNNIDTVVFGEDGEASDGIDEMDIPKPDAPPAPFIHAFLATSLPDPYDMLWEEFRLYPADEQVWNLDIETQGSGEFTTVTMTWNPADITISGYDNVGLFDMQSQQFVADMKTESTFAYISDHGMIYHFQIRCSNNHPPIANDDSFTTNENTVLTVIAPGVLDNDDDPDGDPIEVTGITSGPTDGIANIFADGSFDYTPDVGFVGSDSFVYEITDSEFFDTAIVTIEILALNRIHIQDRWNLISMPVGENINKATIIVEYNAAFHTWQDAIDDGVILGVTYGWQGGVYNDEQILVPGEGYWMWAYQDCDLLIPSNVPGDNHITFLDVEWNLVGVPFGFNLDKTDVNIEFQEAWHTWDTAVSLGIILDFVYGWNRTNQFYVISDDPDTFVSGFGYWVYAFNRCALKKI